MKYVVVLGDGMADWKIEKLGNKTCLESAHTPTLDKLAPRAEVGLCKTVPDGMKPGSDVANMSVLGFNPHDYYTGRSPLEADRH
jgi:2,3-bisphosphoglycerate-independent phosphoglycerate mutase